MLSLVGLCFAVAIYVSVWRPFFQHEPPPEEEWRDPEELPPMQKLKLQATNLAKTSGKAAAAYIKVRPDFAAATCALARASLCFVCWGFVEGVGG